MVSSSHRVDSDSKPIMKRRRKRVIVIGKRRMGMDGL